jgi:hypothetical protein
MAAEEFFLAVFVGGAGARGGLCSAEFYRLANGQIAKGSERVSEAVAAQRQAAKFVSFARMLTGRRRTKTGGSRKVPRRGGSAGGFRHKLRPILVK